MPTTAEVHSETEKRKHGRFEETGLTNMFQVIRLMASDLAGLRSRFEKHMDTEEEQRKEVMDQIQMLSDKIDDVIHLKQAFPQVEGKPDVRGHRHFHDDLKDEEEKSNKFWDRVKEEATTKAVGAIMITLFVIFGLGVKDWATSFIRSAVTTTTTSSTPVVVEKKHE
jgi:hypothetical protein